MIRPILVIAVVLAPAIEFDDLVASGGWVPSAPLCSRAVRAVVSALYVARIVHPGRPKAKVDDGRSMTCHVDQQGLMLLCRTSQSRSA